MDTKKIFFWKSVNKSVSNQNFSQLGKFFSRLHWTWRGVPLVEPKEENNAGFGVVLIPQPPFPQVNK